MKLEQFHEAYDEDGVNQDFVQYAQKHIAQTFTAVEKLSEEAAVPLDPFDYHAANATQEKISEWYNILLVNDTDSDDYAQALNAIQTPVVQYFNEFGDGYIANAAIPQLKSMIEPLGDRFTFTQLAAVNKQWVEVASANSHSSEDLMNDPDLLDKYRDDQDYAADPSAYHGVRNSDFI